MATTNGRLSTSASSSYVAHRSIRDCSAEVWNSVAAQSGNVFMEHGFIAAVEEAFSEEVRFEHVVTYDDGRAIACGSLCAFPFDLDLLADGALRKLTTGWRRLFPTSLKLNVIFCGLPVSVGSNQLAFATGANTELVLGVVHRLATSFARRVSAPFVIFKEFSAAECRATSALDSLNYRRFSSPPMNLLDRGFADFDVYSHSLRSRYRHAFTGR
jgi:hypothetical protein